MISVCLPWKWCIVYTYYYYFIILTQIFDFELPFYIHPHTHTHTHTNFIHYNTVILRYTGKQLKTNLYSNIHVRIKLCSRNIQHTVYKTKPRYKPMCNHAGLRLRCALQTQTEFNSIRTLLLFRISFRTWRFIMNFLGEKISSGRSHAHYIILRHSILYYNTRMYKVWFNDSTASKNICIISISLLELAKCSSLRPQVLIYIIMYTAARFMFDHTLHRS